MGFGRRGFRAGLVLITLICGAWVPTAASAQRCLPPEVLLTVDRSSSMLGSLPSGETKWDAATMAIEEVTRGYADDIDFGLQVFPYPNRCEPGRVTIDVGPNDPASIISALGAPPPSAGNWTPMAETLNVILDDGVMNDRRRDRHVILITDGWQWCSPHDPATRFTPVSAVDRLRAEGLTVHVVGFGGAVDSLTLNRAAVTAGTDLPGCDPELDDPAARNHCYTQANDLMDLRAALADIAGDITDEICDGIDNDCDGEVDEGFDRDGDGYSTCGFNLDLGELDRRLADCNDRDRAVHPGAMEVCDGVDNDCDGSLDAGCDCTLGEERPCGTDIGACLSGRQRCETDGWSACFDSRDPVATEACDDQDNDCDGTVDEDAICPAGQACFIDGCRDLEEPTDEPREPLGDDYLMDPGCGCDTVGRSSDSDSLWGLGLIGFLGLLVARRRK